MLEYVLSVTQLMQYITEHIKAHKGEILKFTNGSLH